MTLVLITYCLRFHVSMSAIYVPCKKTAVTTYLVWCQSLWN